MTAYLEIGPCSRPHVKHASRQVFEQLLPHPREPLVNLPHNRRQEESCGVTCERFAEDQSEHGGPEQPCQDERDPYPRCAQRYESHGRLERGRHMSPLRLNEQAAVYPELLVIVHAHLEASRASARASASASVVGKVRRAGVSREETGGMVDLEITIRRAKVSTRAKARNLFSSSLLTMGTSPSTR